jgi:hypothetical protein
MTSKILTGCQRSTKIILKVCRSASIQAVTLILEPRIFDPHYQSEEGEGSWDTLDALLSEMATSSLKSVMVVHMERAEELEVLESIEDGLEFLSRILDSRMSTHWGKDIIQWPSQMTFSTHCLWRWCTMQDVFSLDDV